MKLRSALLALSIVTLPALAMRASATPLLPIVTPAGGYYKGSVPAALQVPGPPVSIYYTTDGSTPTHTHGTLYVPSTTIPVSSSLTLKAISYDGSSSSAVTSAAFTISGTATTAMPVITPNGGNYTTGPIGVAMSSATPGASIYYTTDGSVPTTSSTLYTGTISLGATTTVRAIAVASGAVTSGVARSSFVFGLASTCAAPTFSLGSRSFTGWINITMTCSTPGAIIRYTTDGSTPTALSTQYTSAKYLGVTTVLTARAFAPGYADSPSTTGTYTADTTPPTQFNVQSYGASTTSTDNTSAVQAALNAAQNVSGGTGPKRGYVYFPTGTYQFNNTVGLKVINSHNIIIDGQGSTLVFANATAAFNFFASNNVTIENMIIDSALPTATPGTVTESDTTGFDCLLDPGFLAADVGSLPAIVQIDPITGGPYPMGLDLYSTPSLVPTILGPGKVRVPKSNLGLAQGAYVNLRRYTYTNSAVTFNGADGVTVKNVTLYSSSSMGVTAQACADLSLTNVNTLIKPGSGRVSSTTSDGSHFTNCKGTICYQDCEFQSQDDDGINVCGLYFTISSVNYSTNQINVYFQKSDQVVQPTMRAGEVIEFRNGTTAQLMGTALITSVTQLGGSPLTAQLTLAIAPPAGITLNSDVVDSLSWTARTSIVRCNFLSNRGHGSVVQNPNTLITDCRYLNTGAGGIHLRTEINPWYEATGVSNAQVLNNSFEGCNAGWDGGGGSIYIFAQTQSGGMAPAGAHSGIVVADNTIRDTNNAGIVVASLDDGDLINNTIENAGIHPTFTYGNQGIYVLDSSNIRINSNVGVQSNYLRYAYNFWQPYWSPPVSGSYNVQPFVIAFSQTAAHEAQWQYSWNVQSALPTGEAVFADLCNSSGTTIATLPVGDLGDPSTWQNGLRAVSSATPVDLTSVPDGTYTVRAGLYSPSTGIMLNLLGKDDGTGRIITGTLTLAGSGSTITYASSQCDMTPSISQFTQIGPRQFTYASTWHNFDTIPSGENGFVQICNSTGTIVQNLPVGNIGTPSTWTPGSVITSPTQTVTLTNSIADGTYTFRLGLTAASRLPISGQNDGSNRTITGTLTTATGTVVPIGWDAVTTTNVSSSGNTGF